MNKSHLENSLLKICIQPRSFEYISHKMGGLDPIKILKILNDLKSQDLVSFQDEYWTVSENKNSFLFDLNNQNSELYLKRYMGYFDFLENPHPLDFEWRNTLKSLNYLTNLIQESSSISDDILLLGMPTLLANCSNKDIQQKVTLVERNKPIIRSLDKFCNGKIKVIEDDIFHANPSKLGKYDMIVMDPPWYSNFLYQFVWLASNCLKPNGVLIISIPPINTRKQIDKERVNWFSFCQKHGLCIEQLLPEKLEYAMPFFEFNAFRQAGVSSVSPFWRKGDLVFFRKTNDIAIERPILDVLSEGWKEVSIGNVRIRVNVLSKNEETEEVRINSIIKGDILPSVSRSHPDRNKANVWTSGNRIFNVNSPLKFWKSLNNKNDESTNSWKEMILEIEENEYKEYLHHIYYEMERDTI